MGFIDVSTYPSVQDAWNAVRSGDTFYIPGGDWPTWDVQESVEYDNVTVRGEGRASRVIGQTDFQTVFTVRGRTGWKFHDFAIRGPGNGRRVTPGSEGTGIQLISCHSASVYNMWIANCGRKDAVDPGIGGVYLREGCTECNLHHNEVTDSNNAFTIDAYVSPTPPKNNKIDHNIIRRCRVGIGTDSMTIAGELGRGLTIIGNDIDGHAEDTAIERYGVRCSDEIGAVVESNSIKNVNVGIEVHSNAQGCTIRGNPIADIIDGPYGGYGIWIRAQPLALERFPNGCRIEGNPITNTPKHGIYAEGGINIDLDNNTIRGARGNGIEIAIPYVGACGNRVHEPLGHGIHVTGNSGSTWLVNNFLKGNPYDTQYLSDAIRIDALSGGPVTVLMNALWNAQVAAGFRYGIHRPSGPVQIEHGGNKFFRLQGSLQGPYIVPLVW